MILVIGVKKCLKLMYSVYFIYLKIDKTVGVASSHDYGISQIE